MDKGDSANVYTKLQTNVIHKCNTITLSSLCIATAFVPKVESGERAGVPKGEFGK